MKMKTDTRPPNAWVLYMKDKRAMLANNASPTISASEMFKYIGNLWKHESNLVRDFYSNLSLEGQKDHQKAHPHYRIHQKKTKSMKKRINLHIFF